jgi:epoxyqueuosine reductase QueG
MPENDGKSNQLENLEKIKGWIRSSGVDVWGIADLDSMRDIPCGVPSGKRQIFSDFHRAVILGAQYGKLGDKASGSESSFFLEKAAYDIQSRLIVEEKKAALMIHTDDEFDARKRMGLLSLKALAKAAGLGWQGRSLLIVSPEYGPLHRLAAVLTDMPLPSSSWIPNRCGECRVCVDRCPAKALTHVAFKDHPESREDVLDIQKCLGDHSCTVCITTCPFFKVFPGS